MAGKNEADDIFDSASADDVFDAAPSASAPAEPPKALPVEEQPPGWFEPKSYSGSLLRGFGQGASLGFADELGGAGMAGVATLADLGARVAGYTPEQRDELRYKLTGAQPGGSMYAATRDSMRREDKQSKAANPITFGGSELVGNIMAPVPGMAARAPLQTVGARMVQGAKYGAALGGATALGHSEEDSLAGQALDTAGGAVLGGAMGSAVGPAEYAFARKVQPWLMSMARDQARKAVTPEASLVNILYNMGYSTPEKLDEFGQVALDSGTIGFGRSTKGIYEKALEKRDALGPRIGDFTKERQALVDDGIAPPANRDEAIQAVKDGLRSWANTDARRAAAPSIERRLYPAAGELPKPDPGELALQSVRGGESLTRPELTFPEFWQNKSQMQDALKPNELAKIGDEGYAAGVKAYTRNVWDQMERGLGPQKIDELRDVTKEYGANEELINLLGRAYTRAENRQPVGLGDMKRGELIGDALQVPGAGLVASGLSAAIRPRWNSSVSAVAKGLGEYRPGEGASQAVKAITSATAAQATSNAYDALLQRFGITTKSKQELADEAFLKGQTDPSMQNGR